MELLYAISVDGLLFVSLLSHCIIKKSGKEWITKNQDMYGPLEMDILWPNWISSRSSLIFPPLPLLNEISPPDQFDPKDIILLFGMFDSSK